MKPTPLAVFVDDALVPTIEMLTDHYGVGCSRAYLAMLMTRALIDAEHDMMRAQIIEANMIHADFDIEDEFDDEDDEPGTKPTKH